MFSATNLTKSTLLCGPKEFTKAFVFEAAIHWAEEGNRVIYITQSPLNALPAIYHDRNKHSPAAFKLMRFMYLSNYEELIEQLVELHTFAVLPSVLLIDDLDAYVYDSAVAKSVLDVHIAKLCAIIHDSTNACARILKCPVHLCAAISKYDIDKTPYAMYFENAWNLRVLNENEDGRTLELAKRTKDNRVTDEIRQVFNYENFTDGSLILRRISEKFISCS